MGINIRSPSNTIPKERSGEHSLEGFRYQAAFTAKLCLELFSPDTNIEEIFCEHFEDIVLKLLDGTFVAIQVKHNKPSGTRFTTSTERIRNSIKRFVTFEKDFPTVFSRYLIVSNNFAWSTQKNYKNIESFLDSLKNYDQLNDKQKDSVDAEIDLLSKECSIDKNELILVLKKTYTQSAYGYSDYEKSLTLDIGLSISDKTSNLLKHIIIKEALINKIFSCSGINCDYPKKEYFNIISLPLEKQIKYEVNNKRINKEDIIEIIDAYTDPSFVLQTLTDDDIDKIPPGFEIMEKKMIIGGIHNKSIRNIKNHKITVEEYFVEYYYKNKEEASTLYTSLRSAILTECDECFNKKKKKDTLFGQEMYDLFSDRTHEVYEDLKQYNYEGLNRYHLLGLSGILTEECEVWWSKEYELGESA